MLKESKRYAFFEDRVKTAWDGLHADVEKWRDSLPEGTTIKHHVAQFDIFCGRARDCLIKAYQAGGWVCADKQVAFDSLVTGTLTSQWMVLRQVAAQRLTGSPYQQDLAGLDKKTAEYYSRLLQALPESVRSRLAKTPPLVYLGRLAELTRFSQDGPAVLTVPFGAPYNYRSELAIPHETAHAIFKQIPGFFPNLERQVMDALDSAEPEPNRQQAVLHEMIIDWLPEIVADLAGTALCGPDFANNALWVTVSPDSTVSIADKEHPVALIRPYVHLAALNYLAENNPDFKQNNAAKIDDFKASLAEVVESYLDRRFDSVPALTVVSLKAVKDEMVAVIPLMLSSKLKGSRKSLGDVLVACATNKPVGDGVALPAWGEISDEECQHFVLKFPDQMRPDQATPVASRYDVCCVMGLFFCC